MAKFHFQSFLLFLLTTPYYRSLRHSTLKPTDSIIQSSNVKDLKERLQRWFHRKDRELSFVNAGGTISAALTVSVFSWPSITDTVWYARALFYSSLVLAITALVAVTQESVLLDDFRQSYASVFAAMQRVSKRSTLLPNSATTVAESRDHSKSRATEAEVKHMLAFLVVPTGHDVVGKESITADCLLQMVNRSRRSKVMMFLWQCPIMLMSYSWALFIVALTLHVLRPFLLRQVWNDDSKIATLYAVVAALCACLFLTSPLWPRFQLQRSAYKIRKISSTV